MTVEVTTENAVVFGQLVEECGFTLRPRGGTGVVPRIYVEFPIAKAVEAGVRDQPSPCAGTRKLSLFGDYPTTRRCAACSGAR